MAGEGREGDWDCSGCRNRNYAFRSFCNRCKQPRLLVDTKTPKDSKWLPRIGDWICTGCSNNNYASRKNCKKCGKSKEEAAMPAISMPGMSLPTYAHYVARTQGLPGLKMNFGMPGNLALQQSLLATANWPYGGLGRYGLHSSPSWPFNGSDNGGISYANNTNQFPIFPKDWRDGDWICTCGFHNYSSRSQCKECNAPITSDAPSATMKTTVSDIFPTLGTKRLASEEFVNDWDSKRLNAGHVNRQFSTNSQHLLFEGFGEEARCSNDQAPGMHSKYANGNLVTLSSGQLNLQSPQIAGMPALLGKGAKQWREGDWMCCNCSNHNFASRTYCNRCKTEKEAVHPAGAL